MVLSNIFIGFVTNICRMVNYIFQFRNSQPILNVKVSKYLSAQMIKIVFHKVGCSLTLSGRYGRKTSQKKFSRTVFRILLELGQSYNQLCKT